jgi:hypothetical protein
MSFLFFRDRRVHFCELCIVLRVADIVSLLFPMLTSPFRKKGELPWYLRHGDKHEPVQSARSCIYPLCPGATAGCEPKVTQSSVQGGHMQDGVTLGMMKRFQGEDEGLTKSLRVDEGSLV